MHRFLAPSRFLSRCSQLFAVVRSGFGLVRSGFTVRSISTALCGAHDFVFFRSQPPSACTTRARRYSPLLLALCWPQNCSSLCCAWVRTVACPSRYPTNAACSPLQTCVTALIHGGAWQRRKRRQLAAASRPQYANSLAHACYRSN